MQSFTASVFKTVRRQAQAYQAGPGGMGRPRPSARTARPVTAPQRVQQTQASTAPSSGTALRIADSLSTTPLAQSIQSRLVSTPARPVTPATQITAPDVTLDSRTLHPDARLQLAVSSDGHGRVAVLESTNGIRVRTRYQTLPDPNSDIESGAQTGSPCRPPADASCPGGSWIITAGGDCDCVPCEQQDPGGCAGGDWAVIDNTCHCVTSPDDCEEQHPGECPSPGEWMRNAAGECVCLGEAPQPLRKPCNQQPHDPCPDGTHWGQVPGQPAGACDCLPGEPEPPVPCDQRPHAPCPEGQSWQPLPGMPGGCGCVPGDEPPPPDPCMTTYCEPGTRKVRRSDLFCECVPIVGEPPDPCKRVVCSPGYVRRRRGDRCVCVPRGGGNPCGSFGECPDGTCDFGQGCGTWVVPPVPPIRIPWPGGGGAWPPVPIDDDLDDIDDCEKCPEGTKAFKGNTVDSTYGGLVKFASPCPTGVTVCAPGTRPPAPKKEPRKVCCKRQKIIKAPNGDIVEVIYLDERTKKLKPGQTCKAACKHTTKPKRRADGSTEVVETSCSYACACVHAGRLLATDLDCGEKLQKLLLCVPELRKLVTEASQCRRSTNKDIEDFVKNFVCKESGPSDTKIDPVQGPQHTKIWVGESRSEGKVIRDLRGELGHRLFFCDNGPILGCKMWAGSESYVYLANGDCDDKDSEGWREFESRGLILTRPCECAVLYGYLTAKASVARSGLSCTKEELQDGAIQYLELRPDCQTISQTVKDALRLL